MAGLVVTGGNRRPPAQWSPCLARGRSTHDIPPYALLVSNSQANISYFLIAPGSFGLVWCFETHSLVLVLGLELPTISLSCLLVCFGSGQVWPFCGTHGVGGIGFRVARSADVEVP